MRPILLLSPQVHSSFSFLEVREMTVREPSLVSGTNTHGNPWSGTATGPGGVLASPSHTDVTSASL